MIREATSNDCASLAALSIQVWLDTYAQDGIRPEYAEFALSKFTGDYSMDLIEDKRRKLVVYEDGCFLRGFASINLDSRFEDESNGFEIEHLYIHGPFQGKGVGRQLLDYTKKHFGRCFWLYTWVENDSNGYYEHLGFRKIGNYKFDFHDWVIKNNVYVHIG